MDPQLDHNSFKPGNFVEVPHELTRDKHRNWKLFQEAVESHSTELKTFLAFEKLSVLFLIFKKLYIYIFFKPLKRFIVLFGFVSFGEKRLCLFWQERRLHFRHLGGGWHFQDSSSWVPLLFESLSTSLPSTLVPCSSKLIRLHSLMENWWQVTHVNSAVPNKSRQTAGCVLLSQPTAIVFRLSF